eukprot:6171850-Pleurochrysis_carterae.AAC.1
MREYVDMLEFYVKWLRSNAASRMRHAESYEAKHKELAAAAAKLQKENQDLRFLHSQQASILAINFR